MNVALAHAPAGAWWKAYARGIALVLPGLVIWALVRTKCVPILVEICHNSVQSTGPTSRLWHTSMLAVRFGFGLFFIAVVALGLLESLSPAWRRYRALGITRLAWLVNFVVLIEVA